MNNGIWEVLKSENGPVIAGLGAVVLLVGGHCVTKSRYRVEAKKESFTMEPASEAEKVTEKTDQVDK